MNRAPRLAFSPRQKPIHTRSRLQRQSEILLHTNLTFIHVIIIQALQPQTKFPPVPRLHALCVAQRSAYQDISSRICKYLQHASLRERKKNHVSHSHAFTRLCEMCLGANLDYWVQVSWCDMSLEMCGTNSDMPSRSCDRYILWVKEGLSRNSLVMQIKCVLDTLRFPYYCSSFRAQDQEYLLMNRGKNYNIISS